MWWAKDPISSLRNSMTLWSEEKQIHLQEALSEPWQYSVSICINCSLYNSQSYHCFAVFSKNRKCEACKISDNFYAPSFTNQKNFHNQTLEKIAKMQASKA